MNWLKGGQGPVCWVNVPTCGKIAVWQLCRERQPLWNSHDSWWPELKMFGSMPWCSFPWQKLMSFQAFTSVFKTNLISHENRQRWTLDLRLSVFLWLPKFRPRPAEGLLPIERTWYQELDRTTEAIVPMNDRWRKLNTNMHQYVPLRASMGQHCSLSAVQRKPLSNSHDGLNLTCLDQCDGARSHGTSSS